jgi:hypothetical protein
MGDALLRMKLIFVVLEALATLEEQFWTLSRQHILK